MDIDLNSEFQKAIQAIKANDNFLLACHIHPDGDALGSMLAMAHALKNAGKNVCATFPEPFEVPMNLQESLPGHHDLLMPYSMCAGIYEVVMTFDCGSVSRLGEIDRLFATADHVINVDHHLSNEKFGTINVIDIHAASSGTVVQKLLEQSELKLTKEIAQCLYVALVTDTGRFQFSSTTSEVFNQAQTLMEFELPVAELSRVLTEEDSFAFLKLAGEVLSEMQLDNQAQFVSGVATIEMQQKYSVDYSEIEGLIEFVRRSREADVACVIKEFEPSDYRVSLRSLGTIDVCEIASEFGGGGHRYAAGFSSHESPEKIIDNVKALVIAQTIKHS